MEYTPESAWMLAGVIVAVLTGIGKKLGWCRKTVL